MNEHEEAGAIEQYWQSYVATVGPQSQPAPNHYQAWAFGKTPEMADRLGELVRSGIKTATASLVWLYEGGIEPYPEIGTLSIILDGQGCPRCIIETTELATRPFIEVDEEHAYLEGEGDRTLRYWRESHWDFFSEECRSIGREPDERMPVLCERFRLVFK